MRIGVNIIQIYNFRGEVTDDTSAETTKHKEDKEAIDLKREWQPAKLWTFLEVITKATLVPARQDQCFFFSRNIG